MPPPKTLPFPFCMVRLATVTGVVAWITRPPLCVQGRRLRDRIRDCPIGEAVAALDGQRLADVERLAFAAARSAPPRRSPATLTVAPAGNIHRLLHRAGVVAHELGRAVVGRGHALRRAGHGDSVGARRQPILLRGHRRGDNRRAERQVDGTRGSPEVDDAIPLLNAGAVVSETSAVRSR